MVIVPYERDKDLISVRGFSVIDFTRIDSDKMGCDDTAALKYRQNGLTWQQSRVHLKHCLLNGSGSRISQVGNSDPRGGGHQLIILAIFSENCIK